MKTLTTSGRTPKQWVAHLKEDHNISSWAESIILNPDFKKACAKKGTQYNIAFVYGRDVPTPRTTDAIRAHAASLGYETPSPEVALLLRESLTDQDLKDMDVDYVVTMHTPITVSGGDPGLLRVGLGGWLNSYWDSPGRRWSTRGAFGFLVPASSSQTSETKGLPSETLNLELRLEKLERFYDRAIEMIPSLEDISTQ